MGVMKRVSLVFKSKANKALDRMEDPRETLDYSYQRQLEMLQQVRRGVADVATSRKRLELQMNSLRQQQSKRESQAKQAVAAGREDLARDALAARATLQGQLDDLDAQYQALHADEEKLTMASQRLHHQHGTPWEQDASDRILCVNNLSRFPQPVELDLRRFMGVTPVECMGGVTFPRMAKSERDMMRKEMEARVWAPFIKEHPATKPLFDAINAARA